MTGIKPVEIPVQIDKNNVNYLTSITWSHIFKYQKQYLEYIHVKSSTVMYKDIYSGRVCWRKPWHAWDKTQWFATLHSNQSPREYSFMWNKYANLWSCYFIVQL